MFKSKHIIFDDDVIEIMRNDFITNKCFLIRLAGWNNTYEMRASEEELRQLSECLISFIKETSDE